MWSFLNTELFTGLKTSSGGWLNRTERSLAAAPRSLATQMEGFYSVDSCLCREANTGKYLLLLSLTAGQRGRKSWHRVGVGGSWSPTRESHFWRGETVCWIIRGNFKLEIKMGFAVTSSGKSGWELQEGAEEPVQGWCILCLDLLKLPIRKVRVHCFIFRLGPQCFGAILKISSSGAVGIKLITAWVLTACWIIH